MIAREAAANGLRDDGMRRPQHAAHGRYMLSVGLPNLTLISLPAPIRRLVAAIARDNPAGAAGSPRASYTESRHLMIVSHKYRFIFLRTEKTASTSMIAALQGILDENDLQASSDRPPWARFSPIHHRALRRHCPQWFGLHTHATASQVRDVIGRKIFDSYYKFVVERNPWDRQVSLYAHRQWKKGQPSDHFDRDMRSFIYRNTSYVRLNNWSKYAIGREIVADRVIRYERLADEIGDLVAMLGLPGPLDLPTLRKYTKDRPHYATYYSDATRDLIGGWYAREIDALGYTFETENASQRVNAAPRADRSRKGIRIGGSQGVIHAEQTVVHGARLAGGMPSSRREVAG